MSENPTESKTTPSTKAIPRNEPCPCRSGKKYKRCCGMDAEPVLSAPKVPAAMPSMPNLGAGFDPSQMDPQMMNQMSQAIQRLPKGQLQKLQSIMQRAMSGQDVTRDAQDLERMLPPEFQQMMMGFAAQMSPELAAAQAAAATDSAPDLSVDDAKKIVEQAMREGKIDRAQADELLKNAEGAESPAAEKAGGIGKFWKGLTGKSASKK